MNVAVVTAATGKGYGDLRPEVAMLKGALLYADSVRVVTGKLPLLLVQTGEQMRSIGELKELAKQFDNESEETLRRILDIVRRRQPDAGKVIEKAIADGMIISALFDVLATVWQERVVPTLGSAPEADHKKFVRDFLPDFVATYARRREIPSSPLVAAANELQIAIRAGVVDVDLLGAQRTYGMDSAELVPETLDRLMLAVVDMAVDPGRLYPLFDDRAQAVALTLAGKSSATSFREVGLAQALVVSLESFPMADMDVVLDVRERLKPTLSRFRAAMASAAKELDELPTDWNFAAAVEELRIRSIAPALQDIEDELDQLDARHTLLRGWPKVAAGTIGLAAASAVKAPDLAQLAPVLAGASIAFTTELAKRDEFKRLRGRNQFFFLHAAKTYLQEALE